MEEQQFASAQNVTMFVDMLRTESDPTKCNTIKSLLLEEETKFANRSEQLRHSSTKSQFAEVISSRSIN